MSRPPRKTSAARRPNPFVAETLALLEGLNATGPFACRAMFGGYGLYHNGNFFGIGYAGRLFFRVDDASRPEYERLGSGPFHPTAKITMRAYYEVPAEVREDPDELCQWALRSSELAARLAKSRKKRPPRKRSAGKRTR